MTDKSISNSARVPETDIAESGKQLPTLKSEALFKQARELLIEHGNEQYRLRITKQDKLILTK